MFTKGLSKALASAACVLAFSSANASTQNSLLVDGEMVQSVYGVWTYNERVSFGMGGTYSLSLTDFNFLDRFDFVGAMVSSSTKSIAEYKLTSESQLSGDIEFQLDEAGDYWISVFAITDSQFNGGTFGLDLQALDGVSEVPAPPALVLMLTSLLGLGSFARRWKNSRKAVK